jgi:hypothetical protein
MTNEPARNPALLVAPGTRARLELEGGVAADVIRGETAGPIVWLWAPRGARDPSLLQALDELRDALDPSVLRGAVGLLLDGPPPPVLFPPTAPPAAVGAIARDATAIVLLCGGATGEGILPHAAADPAHARDRRVAAELRLPLITPTSLLPPLDRTLVPCPVAWLVAGEEERVDRAVILLVREAVRALLIGLGLVEGTLRKVHRNVARRLIAVPLPPAGLLEPTVVAGALVARGQVIALVGQPGRTPRREVRAPTAGVALCVRGGWLPHAAGVVLARPPAALPAAVPPARDEIGWCELVDLPELGVTRLPAKIDTGARTSALHVQSRRLIGREHGRVVYEIVVPAGEGGRAARTAKARVEVVEQAVVRDSGGHAEKRPVIETMLCIGDRWRRVRVSLTDRGDMRFPMLVGRTGPDARTRIDPTRAFLTQPAKSATAKSSSKSKQSRRSRRAPRPT